MYLLDPFAFFTVKAAAYTGLGAVLRARATRRATRLYERSRSASGVRFAVGLVAVSFMALASVLLSSGVDYFLLRRFAEVDWLRIIWC